MSVNVDPFEGSANAEPSPGVGDFREAGEEFHYQPVSSLAVCALVLGFFSLVGIVLWWVLPFAFLAISLGIFSLISIRRWAGEYAGTGIAITGIVLGLITAVTGTTVQIYAFRHEVPPGFQRISFIRDIASKEFVIDRKGLAPHHDVVELVGKKVFFKGFIYPTDKNEGLTSFLLLKDSEECCFGGKPKLTDKVGCILQNGKTCNYMAGRVSVAGTFRINPKFNGLDTESLYLLETEIVGHSKSDF